jgi:hypothetical protein
VDFPDEVTVVVLEEPPDMVTEQIVLRSKKLGCSMIILEQEAYLFLLTDFS